MIWLAITVAFAVYYQIKSVIKWMTHLRITHIIRITLIMYYNDQSLRIRKKLIKSRSSRRTLEPTGTFGNKNKATTLLNSAYFT